MTFKFDPLTTIPSIAQLVERWTVVVLWQISIGRWFKSGSKEFLFFFRLFSEAFDECFQVYCIFVSLSLYCYQYFGHWIKSKLP